MLRLLIVVLLCVGPAHAADKAWVTDELSLGLYAKKGGKGKAERKLTSDTELRVMSKSGNWAKVRTPDGDTGWVKAGFLVSSPPARIALPAVQAENEQLRNDLSASRKIISGNRTQIDELVAQQKLMDADRQQRALQIEQLADENVSLREELNQAGLRIPWIWAIAGVIALLVSGFIGGTYWLDYIIRKRHGGFRIY